MKKIIVATLAAALALPSAAYAQTDQARHEMTAQQDRHEDRNSQQAKPSTTRQSTTRQSAPATKATAKTTARASSSSAHPFAKGSQFSRAKAPNYRRVNYRENTRLKAPPTGYVWVRAGSDALLVRLSNNIVAQVVTSVF